MRIVIAPDSFKDCLSAAEVANHIEAGIKRGDIRAVVHKIPMADGGEGFVDTMLAASGGEKINLVVLDPLGREVQAFYGILKDGTAVIEMAAASGIEHLSKNERNPMVTSTFGTGQLIVNALDAGCKKIIIGIGGSATNDGGTGMAIRLGYRFLDEKGNEIKQGGGGLNLLKKIDSSMVDPRLFKTEIRIACDVSNPLTGNLGASAVYGPQKGADENMIKQLDKNLEHLANIVKRDLRIDVLTLPGGGAAGGLGAGLVAFAGGKLRTGFDIVREQTNLEKYIANADLIFTGEGKIDRQTKNGKTPWGVAQLAKKHGIPLIAFAGKLGDGFNELYNEGFTSVFALANGPATLEDSIKDAPVLLEGIAEKVIRLIKNI